MKCPGCQAEILNDSRFCSKCGTPIHSEGKILFSHTRTILKPQEELHYGTELARKYRILEVVGRGGMGVVYKAEDLKLKRNVALKFLPAELVKDPEAKERFVLEARAAAALSHPNICTIHEIEEAEGKSFIAMEYVDGQSLREKLKKDSLELDEALEVAIQITDGLNAAHKKDIIHRDIKSANIMVTENGQVKIMDFGLAKVKGGTLLTREGTTLGTVAYMSPEQARGEDVDHRTDIWSLGVVLYEMFGGRLPFQGEREASILYSVVNEEPKSLKSIKPDIPSAVLQIIDRAIKKKPESRYVSAEDMLKDLRKFRDSLKAEQAGIFNLRSFFRWVRRPIVAFPAIVLIAAICFSAVWYFNRQAKIRWARQELLPDIERLIATSFGDTTEVFKLVEEAKKYLSDDPRLSELMVQCSSKVTVKTNPPGAKIFSKVYRNPNDEWEFLGISPIEDLRVPLTHFRWKMEKDEYETVYAVTATFGLDFSKKKGIVPVEIVRDLDKEGSIPEKMVRVRGAELSIGKFGDFFLDRYEVTNKQYKEFVDSGAYRDRKYWKHEFFKDGRALSWEEAMAEFIDQTGRPGPATWKAGNYPEGGEDHPVSGVSWYEAAAYAEFVGKTLPTGYHWDLARVEPSPWAEYTNFFNQLYPLSNFKDEGPASVGSHPGMTLYGAYDMAGNVREWCWNESQKGRVIRGGAWNDTTYMFLNWSQSPPFDRSPKNGFRCTLYPGSSNMPEKAQDPLQISKAPDFYSIEPVPDPIFQVYKEQYAYDKTDLNVQIEQRDENAKDWVQETITFDTAYGEERMMAHLFLPKNTLPPYQTVVYFPGAGSMLQESSKDLDQYYEFVKFLSFLVTSGRAVFYPVYEGTFERRKTVSGSHQYSEHRIHQVQDLMRSIDYLETRSDINGQKLAYFGVSWGAWTAPIILAVEERLKTGILYVGGLRSSGLPEVNPINFVTRVKAPILMLNGKYDMSFSLENSVKPMYDLLGTPDEDKELKVYEMDHFVPLNELIRETLTWLDRYLGPVR